MDADEFFDWMAFENLQDPDTKSKLLEDMENEKMDPLEKQAAAIKQMFQTLAKRK